MISEKSISHPTFDPVSLESFGGWLGTDTLCTALHNEIHARPFPRLEAPLRASFYALLTGEEGRELDRAHLLELARICDADLSFIETQGNGPSFIEFECNGLRVRWERHTEFSTYTFLRAGEFETPFEETALDLVSQEWLKGLRGQPVTACHLAIQKASSSQPHLSELHEWFDHHRLIASDVVEGTARIWTALQLHDDGFGRFYVHDESLTDCRAGRLVQRLFEMETYRSLSLLSLPLAREIGPQLSSWEAEIGTLMCDLINAVDLDTERRLLAKLTELAAKVEKARARSSYRFGATEAYYQIMEQRLHEMRETQIDGFQTFGEFLERRVPPAIRTCQSVTRRAESLSARLDRAGDLLRTRIDLTLEAQNQQILSSMERRADLQLRLQETVEGLSLAAVSYYLFQLFKYGGTALAAWGIPISHRWVDALALPIAVGVAWGSVQRAKHHLRRTVEDAGELSGVNKR